MQFAFRWMNCLLMREISVENTVRMWDTYLVRVAAFRFCVLPVPSCACLASDAAHADAAPHKLTISRVMHAHSGFFDRPRAPTRSRSSIFMSAQRSLCNGARSYRRWTSRCALLLIRPDPRFNKDVGADHFAPLPFAGHYHVFAVAPNARLDGLRDRDAPQRGVRPLFDVA